MFHKPKGAVTARRDERHKTVMDYFPEEDRDILFPVGRLDKDTEGFLIVTDDGAFTYRLLSPESGIPKTYFFYALGVPDAEKLAARMIADAINAKPEFKLGLATGATMENVYAELSKLNKAGEVDFSQVRSWNLDEYVGLAPEHDQSYRYYMNKHLFNNVNIDIRNTHLPDGLALDEEAEAARYDKDYSGILPLSRLWQNEAESEYRGRRRKDMR